MAVWGQDEMRTAWELLCRFCETEEAAAHMGVAVSEFKRLCVYHFSDRFDHAPSYDEVLERCRAAGRSQVRVAQFEAMLEGDRSMLIAMGKEYLGQSGEAKEPHVTEREATTVDSVLADFADAPDRKSRAKG